MNLYEIKAKLLNQEKIVFSLNELARIIGKSKNIAGVYANRMCKKKLLYKIEKNKFSVSEDVFVISSQLIFPSYLGLTTSLYFQDFMPQIIDKIYVITSKQKKKIKVFGTDIIFIKIKPKLLFGYKKIKKTDSFIFISDLEKTIIDCLLYPRYCRLNILLDLLKKADINNLKYYLSLLNSERINRKIGYLLDILNIKHNLKRKTNTIYKFNSSKKFKGKFNNKWFLYINEEFR